MLSSWLDLGQSLVEATEQREHAERQVPATGTGAGELPARLPCRRRDAVALGGVLQVVAAVERRRALGEQLVGPGVRAGLAVAQLGQRGLGDARRFVAVAVGRDRLGPTRWRRVGAARARPAVASSTARSMSTVASSTRPNASVAEARRSSRPGSRSVVGPEPGQQAQHLARLDGVGERLAEARSPWRSPAPAGRHRAASRRPPWPGPRSSSSPASSPRRVGIDRRGPEAPTPTPGRAHRSSAAARARRRGSPGPRTRRRRACRAAGGRCPGARASRAITACSCASRCWSAVEVATRIMCDATAIGSDDGSRIALIERGGDHPDAAVGGIDDPLGQRHRMIGELAEHLLRPDGHRAGVDDQPVDEVGGLVQEVGEDAAGDDQPRGATGRPRSTRRVVRRPRRRAGGRRRSRSSTASLRFGRSAGRAHPGVAGHRRRRRAAPTRTSHIRVVPRGGRPVGCRGRTDVRAAECGAVAWASSQA